MKEVSLQVEKFQYRANQLPHVLKKVRVKLKKNNSNRSKLLKGKLNLILIH